MRRIAIIAAILMTAAPLVALAAPDGRGGRDRGGDRRGYEARGGERGYQDPRGAPPPAYAQPYAGPRAPSAQTYSRPYAAPPPGYGAPPPGYGARGPAWRQGQYLPPQYRGAVVQDRGRYRLRPPPPGYDWVGVGPDIYLMQRSTGMVLDIIPGGY